MRIFFFILTSLLFTSTYAQETISPAPKQTAPIAITGATLHVGNGQVLPNASLRHYRW